MKARELWVLVGGLLIFVGGQGCTVSFPVHASGQAMIQASPLGELPVSFAPLGDLGAFDITQTQDFKNQGVSKSQVQSVKLTSLSMTITQPSGETFSFLNSITFDAGAENESTVPVAQKNPVPSTATTFNLDVDDVELVDYVAAPSMSITATAAGQPPSQDTTITIDVTFEVTAKI